MSNSNQFDNEYNLTLLTASGNAVFSLLIDNDAMIVLSSTTYKIPYRDIAKCISRIPKFRSQAYDYSLGESVLRTYRQIPKQREDLRFLSLVYYTSEIFGLTYESACTQALTAITSFRQKTLPPTYNNLVYDIIVECSRSFYNHYRKDDWAEFDTAYSELDEYILAMNYWEAKHFELRTEGRENWLVYHEKYKDLFDNPFANRCTSDSLFENSKFIEDKLVEKFNGIVGVSNE